MTIYLENISNYDCKTAISLYKERPSEFERFVDNKLMKISKDMCRLSNEGPEPMFGYFIGCEYERRTVNIISNGVRTNTPESSESSPLFQIGRFHKGKGGRRRPPPV